MSKARPITEAEFKRTLAVARGTRHPERNILCLMLSARAGMRVGEIGGLDLADAYDEHAGAVRDRIYLAAERTKWAHAREVHLNHTVRRELGAYLRVRGMAGGALMLTQSGKRFGRTALVGLFGGLYQRAGIDTSSHAGRALFITSLADKGVSLRIVQKAVGHKSLSATNHYFSARPAEVSAAVELLR
jgi:integrase/recombinase XerD